MPTFMGFTCLKFIKIFRSKVVYLKMNWILRTRMFLNFKRSLIKALKLFDISNFVYSEVVKFQACQISVLFKDFSGGQTNKNVKNPEI